MAITVNGDSFPWQSTLTRAQIIEAKKFSFPLKTVFVNGTRLKKEVLEDYTVNDGDEVNIVHMMSGG